MLDQAVKRVTLNSFLQEGYKGLHSPSVRKARAATEKREPCISMIEVCKRVGKCSTTINKWILEGKFPKPDFYTGTSAKRYWKISTFTSWNKQWLEEMKLSPKQ